ncbi:hypothetical protein WICPIJ_009419 [Wickerhamomyces pijperi]|uniref:Xylulose kinase n=1 Tax=Wickerhamomyces pijperi TaxID=599730 RepID=A0A9P8PNV7_WICPI|nr:hypothetical protein WICPIJ_009419 [Wickerhamomyces pijperi]
MTASTTSPDEEDSLFLGFDLSTQQLKIIATTIDLQIHSTYTLEFDSELPQYKTTKGVYINDDTGEILSSVALWIEALDCVLTKMQKDGFPFQRVQGISGSCQQHGSVFWSDRSGDLLTQLDPQRRLVDQLIPHAFTLQTSPNWQDHSTGLEIAKFEKYLHGAERLAEITGSRAHYRFTGPQICKMARTQPKMYHDTFKISLVSSFLHSLLAGALYDIDESDACGMNLYDIKERQWNEECLAIACLSHAEDGVLDQARRDKAVRDLKKKLGPVIKVGSSPVSTISQYFIQRYGFPATTQIYPFTGDNLATIMSLPLQKDDLLISLGTSTTVLLVTETYRPSSSYHVFIHPTIPNAYMGMICYCNGALAREKVRDLVNAKYHSSSWDKFNQILSDSEGFDDQLGVYLPLGEIVPNKKQQTIRGKLTGKNQLELVDSWDIDADVSSIVESQALSCRARAAPMLSIRDSTTAAARSSSVYPESGLMFDEKLIPLANLQQRPNKVYYVGGGSRNLAIVSKFGEILGSIKGDFKCENPNACALGGAFKAVWSHQYLLNESKLGFDEFLKLKYDYSQLEQLAIKQGQWEGYERGMVLLNELEKALV